MFNKRGKNHQYLYLIILFTSIVIFIALFISQLRSEAPIIQNITLVPTHTPEPTFTVTASFTPTSTLTETILPSPTATYTKIPTISTNTNTPLLPTATITDTVTVEPCVARGFQGNINVRTEPQIGHKVIREIRGDIYVHVIARSPDNSWFQIRYEDKIGWISADLVEKSGGCQNVPPADNLPLLSTLTSTPQSSSTRIVELISTKECADRYTCTPSPMPVVVLSTQINPSPDTSTPKPTDKVKPTPETPQQSIKMIPLQEPVPNVVETIEIKTMGLDAQTEPVLIVQAPPLTANLFFPYPYFSPVPRKDGRFRISNVNLFADGLPCNERIFVLHAIVVPRGSIVVPPESISDWKIASLPTAINGLHTSTTVSTCQLP